MDERQEPIHVVREEEVQARQSHASAWLGAGVVALVIALAVTAGYVSRQKDESKQLVSRDNELNATVSQMQNQIDTLTSKLDQPAAAPVPVVTPEQLSAANASAKRRAAEDAKRFNTIQSSIDDQQKALADTQSQVSETRSDLEAGINSTREDLNGSIARTHDELVSLEQKGERSYFEFDITKAKHFQKEGPLMVSLRKTDPKHEKYDLAMVVDDNQLSKKNVNLYEPVWIAGADHAQVQLVVNKIDKEHIHGYVSAPKYAESASMTNVSERTGTAMSGANQNPSDTSAAPAGNTNPTDGSPTSVGGAPVTTTPEQQEQQP
jgi:outer membrane murein-binding lipoprotein Lpp